MQKNYSVPNFSSVMSHKKVSMKPRSTSRRILNSVEFMDQSAKCRNLYRSKIACKSHFLNIQNIFEEKMQKIELVI